ncbi:uncharacterized protein LOC144630165 isoform X2 [Oculina patagonica]
MCTTVFAIIDLRSSPTILVVGVKGSIEYESRWTPITSNRRRLYGYDWSVNQMLRMLKQE